MARPLRIEFPGAIYHVMSRGNARQTVFRDDSDYQRLIKGLETVVGRLGWDLLCFVLMPNHFHLLVRTPRPNLSRGMQHLTSGYANWCSRRHRRPGHTFQGRFKSELIEDESYFWTVSRYIQLNPVRGKRPLADHPRDWPWVGTDQEFSAILDHLESTTGFGFFLVSIPKSDSRTSPSSSSSSRTRRESRSASLF